MSDLDLCLGRRETAIHGAILLSARDNTPQNKFQRRGDENSLNLLVFSVCVWWGGGGGCFLLFFSPG